MRLPLRLGLAGRGRGVGARAGALAGAEAAAEAVPGTAGPLRRPRAVALDLDGTLLSAAGAVTPATAAAVRAFSAAGGVAVIATGRGRAFAEEKLEVGGLRGAVQWLVCADGAVVYDLRGGQSARLHWTSMRAGRDWPPLAKIRAAVPGCGLCAEIDDAQSVHALIDSRAYIDAIEEGAPSFAARFLVGREPSAPGEFDAAFRAAERIGWMRLVPPRPEEGQLERVAAVLREHAAAADLEVVQTSVKSLKRLGGLTISRRGTDKSKGLQVVADALGLSAADFLAFGDQFNDLEMFEWAGQSMCPANANEVALRAASHVSEKDNDTDFIAHALEAVAAGPAPRL